ncbi:hypothetical protein PFISCL1PPCAC_26230, partial [Pristionchus fissidentatus]
PLGRVLELVAIAGQNVEMVDELLERVIGEGGEGAEHATHRRVTEERIEDTTTVVIASLRLTEEVEGDG